MPTNAISGVGAPTGNQNARTHGAYSKRRVNASRTTTPKAGTQALDPLVAPLREAELLLPTLDTIIKELWARQQDLARHVHELQTTRRPEDSPRTITGILALEITAQSLYRQNAATLGRLIKYKEDIKQGGGGDTTEAHDAMSKALDDMAKELGVTL